jgi:beta-lactamase superfamily II metal-dependent hydrolase
MSDNAALDLYFLDCGRGDTILIRFPDGSMGMVDCCFPEKEARSTLLPGIERLLGDKPFHFLCLSHPHGDHFKGMVSVLTALGGRLKSFWCSSTYWNTLLRSLLEGIPSESDFKRTPLRELFDLDRLVRQLRQQQADFTIVDVREGRKLGSFGGVEIEALSPSDAEWRTYLREVGLVYIEERAREADRNHVSNSLLLSYGDCSVILGGDALKLVWCWLGVRHRVDPSHAPLRFRVMKAAHHGSNSAFDRIFFKQCMDPSQQCHAIICGRNSSSGRRECSDLLAFSGAGRLQVYFVANGGPPILPSAVPSAVAQALENSSAPVHEHGTGGLHARVFSGGQVEINRLQNWLPH